MTQASLSPAGGESPKVIVRLPRPQHARVTELAERRGTTVSALVRAGLAVILAEQGADPAPP